MNTEKINVQSPDGKHKAVILPGLGGTLASLQLNTSEVIQFPLINSSSWRDGFPSSVLFPFPNRIDGGKYTYMNSEYHLPINEISRGHAIHGLVAEKPFDVLLTTEHQVQLAYSLDGEEKGYPFKCELMLDYSLTNEGLEFSFRITNQEDVHIPVAFGWHPYFRLEDYSIDTLQLELPKHQEVQVNSAHIPTGNFPTRERQARALNGLSLDTAYLLKEMDWVETKLISSTQILTVSQWCDLSEGLKYLVVYTPNTRDCIAIEPQTANINSFNNHEGLILLNPGESKSGKMKVTLQKL
jgi:aldose 1-epimerase